MEIYNCKLHEGLNFQNNKYCGLNLQDFFQTSEWAKHKAGLDILKDHCPVSYENKWEPGPSMLTLLLLLFII